MASTMTPAATRQPDDHTIGRATRTVVAAFGVLAALAGIEHGVGEILQGSIAPPGMVFPSWPDTASFAILEGEPAMTLVPNLLATGVLAIVTALTFGVWSVFYAGQRHGGLVLIALSIVLLVVGGGFGPPLIGIILGTAAAVRQAAAGRRPPGRVGSALGRLWPWFLAAGIAGFLGLLPGTVVLGALFDMYSEPLVVAFATVAFGGLALALVAARAHDHGDQSSSPLMSSGLSTWQLGGARGR